MSEIKVGDRVTVIGVTPNESFEGCKGTIVRAGVFHDWIVDVTFPDGNHDELGYDEFELTAPAHPAPAPTDAPLKETHVLFVTVNGEELTAEEYDARYAVAHGFKAQPAPTVGGAAVDDSGLPADWVPSDELDSLDYAVAMLESEFMKNDRYLAVRHHFKSIDEWHSDALDIEATLRAQLAATEARLQAAVGAQERESKDVRLLLELFGDARVRDAISERADHAEVWEVFNRVLQASEKGE